MANLIKHLQFQSNGKLMITGEYLVLKGAESLSLPLKKGQEMNIYYSDKRPALGWKTYVQGKYWFEANFSLPDLVIANTNDFPIAQDIREILLKTRDLNPDFLNPGHHIEAISSINFNISWGLGSSSSLLVNIARWAEIDPFELYFRVSEGSGYDIAAAVSDMPVLYQLRNNKSEFSTAAFYPPFSDKIYFAYLGKKQNSAEAVANFKGRKEDFKESVKEISAITRKIVNVKNQVDFISLLRKHDKIISDILNIKPVSHTRFSDFNGYVKSLGAWGGDFGLFISDFPKEYILSYFRNKEIRNYFQYREIVKSSNPEVNV